MRLLTNLSLPPGTKLLSGLGVLLFLPFLVFAQSKTITGTVKDENGKPVSGASVSIKKQNTGTTTNEAGNFTITAASGDVLIISAVTFETSEVTVGTENNMNVQLKIKATELSDVVVVGYGTKTKRDIGGGVLTVDQRLLQNRPVTNTFDALQGTTPGLVITRTNGQPGREGLAARIRGITSLGVNNSPLVIIDGVEGDLASLNPNDIETISILEDAASASIYGAKAGGGVILVTTKAGKASLKPRFELTTMYTTRTPFARPELLSSRKQGELINAARVSANQNKDFTDQQLEWFDDPTVEDVWNSNSKTWEYYYNNDMVDILMRKQSTQRNINLSASGGSDKSTYLFSVGYLSQQGVFKFGPDSYSRFNARMNYNTKLSKIFSLDTRLSFVKENILAPSTGITGEGLMFHIYSLRAARNPIFTPGTNNSKYAFIGTISTAYPILKDGGYDQEDRYNMNGVISLNAKQILKGLDLKAVYSPGMVFSAREVFAKTVPRFTIDSNKLPIPSTAINQVNSLSKTRPYVLNQNFFATADYDYKFKDHHFHLLGGYEYKTYKYDWVQALQRALLLNNFETLNYTTLATADVTNVADNIQENRWLSYFGRLSYNFASRYYFEGVLRRDGSSRLSPGNKFQTFYSLNAFWRASQEEWFKQTLPWINEFKLAVSYGTAGGAQTANPNASNYDFQSVLARGFYPFNDSRTAFLRQAELASDGKQWEIIETTNFGVDIEVLKRRLRLHFDYFIKENNNVFVGQNLPALLGVTPNAANLAAIQVKGWGVTLNWTDKFRNGGYFVSANLSDDVNKVLRYDGSNTYAAGINSTILGMSTNSIFGYKADGYFDTPEEVQGSPRRTTNTGVGDIKLLDINKDGFINQGIGTAANHGDLVYLGNTNPRYVFGVSAGVNWKGFDLSFLFNGVGKRNILVDPIASIGLYDGWRMPWAIHQDYWRPDNLNAKFPTIRFADRVNDQVSSHWVQDASYIRLKNLQVGYTFSKAKHHVKGLGDIRLYFSGQDLWELTGMWFNYYDPENTDRISFGYPLWRSYAMGLNISF